MTIHIYWVQFFVTMSPMVMGVHSTTVSEIYGNLIKTNLKVTADPCEDFYAYACGNWRTDYNDTDFIDMPGYLDYQVNQQLKALLENITDYNWNTEVYQKAVDLYESCRELKSLVLNPFLQSVHQELHMQWPIFALNQEGNWANSSNFDWLRTVAVLRNYGMNFVFISQTVNVNPRNSSELFVEVSQHLPIATLDPVDVANILTNFGMTAQESHDLTKSLIKFEMSLNALVKYEFVNESENLTYADNFQYFNLSEFKALIPEIDWTTYMQITLDTTENLDDLTIQAFILDTEFFTNLSNLLQRTSNETVAHYLTMRFLYYINANLPHARPRNCIKYMRGFLPLFMNFLYEEYQFKSKRFEVERRMNRMFNNLRHSFQDMVFENHLNLSKEQQKFILKELNTMHLKIGNLPKNCSEQFVATHYAALQTNRSDFVQNHMNLLKFKNRLDYDKLSDPLENIDQKFYNLDADSLSSSSPMKIFDNAILINYGYLQMPLYDTDLNEVYQYSEMGFIMAHEIVHAFDLFHIIYDCASNFDVLGVQVVQHYLPKLPCYGHSPVEVISENIADVSGLRVAYNLYRTLIRNVSAGGTIYNLTLEQLFFVNSVQFLCGDMQQISQLQGQLRDLTHDIHDARVRQNWSKFEEFSQAFNCSPSSNMSPPEVSCRLW